MDNTIDPQVKNLVTAIGRVETGTSSNPYQAVGKSGEYGRYQFMPDTWKQWAPEAGVNTPLQQASIEDQNKVAYYKVKQLKDQGLNPAQIASLWNSGDPNAYKENHVGVNAQGVSYNTPSYVQKVSREYQNLSNQAAVASRTPQQPTMNMQQPEQTPAAAPLTAGITGFLPGVASDLSSRLKQGAGAVGKFAQGALSGDLGQAGSGILQTFGAGAGALGDVIGRTIETVPGVIQGEQALGGLVGKVLNTQTGKAIVNDYQNWAQENPETAQNIGAVLNIASAIPIFKSLSLAGKAGEFALAKGFGKKIAAEAEGEITQALGRSEAANSLIQKGTVKNMIENNHVPDVVVNASGVPVYDSSNAMANIRQKIKNVSAIQDKIASTMPQRYSAPELNTWIADVKGNINVSNPVEAALNEMDNAYTNTFDNTGKVWLESVKNDLNGNGIDVGQINEMARKLGQISSNYKKGAGLLKDSDKAARLENIRFALKDLVNRFDSTKTMRKHDAIIASLKRQLSALRYLDKKKAVMTHRGSIIRETLAGLLGSGGEAVGNAAGIPITGALAGRTAGNLIRPRIESSVERLSKVRSPIMPTIKGIVKKGGRASVLHNAADDIAPQD